MSSSKDSYSGWPDATIVIVFLFLVFGSFVLFIGEPDLHDKLLGTVCEENYE